MNLGERNDTEYIKLIFLHSALFIFSDVLSIHV